LGQRTRTEPRRELGAGPREAPSFAPAPKKGWPPPRPPRRRPPKHRPRTRRQGKRRHCPRARGSSWRLWPSRNGRLCPWPPSCELLPLLSALPPLLRPSPSLVRLQPAPPEMWNFRSAPLGSSEPRRSTSKASSASEEGRAGPGPGFAFRVRSASSSNRRCASSSSRRRCSSSCSLRRSSS